MILEQFLTCPETCAKLSGGPLGRFGEGFAVWLKQLGFTHTIIYRHLLRLSYFNDFLHELSPQSMDVVSFSDIEAFFSDYALKAQHRKTPESHLRHVHQSINRFVAYLTHKGVFAPEEEEVPLYQPLLDEYLRWLSRYRHLATSTIAPRRRSITLFLKWLGPQATLEGLSKLTAADVEAFFLAHSATMAKHTRSVLQTALRTFFTFYRQQGAITAPLENAVPSQRTYRLANVPRGISDEQAQALLLSIDRKTSTGKRDYAILMLLYTFGVRCSQVAALQLEDIRWSEAQILFKPVKNGKETLLPLTEEVGNCLFEYIREARPDRLCPSVFMTANAPYRSLCDPSVHHSLIGCMVRRYIIKLGLDLPTKGTHLFRHGFAGRMVAQNYSLKSVADMLGHRRLSSTFIYTKIDFDALKPVTLPWPQEDLSC